MARLEKNAEKHLRDLTQGKRRVLLINPPVHERRYHWLRWNQPSELLRLSSWLKKHSKRADIRLYDFMFPDESGTVPKKKVQETWLRADDRQLWHFGRTFEQFEKDFASLLLVEKWRPDVIIITSLTSYWHTSIERLLNNLCNKLRGKDRERVTICLYGNYPRFEPEHASDQRDADIAFSTTVDTTNVVPDFSLYESHKRAPLFYGLSIYDATLEDQLEAIVAYETAALKRKGISRPPAPTLAFLNENIALPNHQWDIVAKVVQKHDKRFTVEGIAGVEPKHLTKPLLTKLKLANVRSLFVEHARTKGGGLDESAYDVLRGVLSDEAHAKQCGREKDAWLDKGAVTGFVYMGLLDDEIDSVVKSTLYLNKSFQAVILKPFGYSPSVDKSKASERARRWPEGPCAGSPQWFPYAGGGGLQRADYQDLIRWQNLLNKRVKGATFDFLGSGTVSQLVRETLVMESWKSHREAR